MCNACARRKNLQTLLGALRQGGSAPVKWPDVGIPNDLEGKASVRISDSAPIVRLVDGAPVGELLPWAWKGLRGKPIFNFVSEGRNFAGSDRGLVFADGFYEHTAPAAPKTELKDRHLFQLCDQPGFWIAAVAREAPSAC